MPDCVNTPADGALVVRFEWKDWATRILAHRHVANYFFDSATHQIVRKTCVDGAPESTTKIAGFVGSVGHVRCVTNGAEVDCPASPSLPDLIKLTVTANERPAERAEPVHVHAHREHTAGRPGRAGRVRFDQGDLALTGQYVR